MENVKPVSKNKLTDKEKEKLAKEKEKEKEKLAKEKEKQKEKERLAKEKQKEKEKLAREKERQKEKERLAKEKEKQKEKERLAKQKEKEKLAKEKEKQATSKKQVVLTPKKGVEAKPLVSRTLPEEKKVNLSEEVDEKELEQIKENESKNSLNKMQAIMEARQKLNNGVLDSAPSKEGKLKLGKIVLDGEDSTPESKELQALKSRSNAQKFLDSELTTKKDNELQAKLKEASAQFGGLDAIEEREVIKPVEQSSGKVDMLLAQITDLEENIELLNEALDSAENLEYEGIKVCDSETFTLSVEFQDYLVSLKNEIISKSETNTSLRNSLETLKETYETKLKEIEEMNASQLKKVENLTEENKTKSVEYQSKIKKLEDKLSEVTSSNASSKTQLEKVVLERKSLEDEINKLKNDAKTLQEELDEAKKGYLETSRLQEEIKAINLSLSEEVAQSKALQDKVNIQLQEIEALSKLIDEEKHSKETLQAEVEKVNKAFQEELAQTNTLQEEINKYINEKTLLENEVNTSKNQNQMLASQNDALKTNLTSLEDVVKKLEEKEASLTNDVLLHEEKVKVLEEELENSISKAEAQAKLDDELKTFINKCNTLTVEKANLNTRLETTETEIEKLSEKLKESASEVEKLTEEFEKTTSEKDLLNESLAKQNKENLDLKLEITNLKAEIEVLKTPVVSEVVTVEEEKPSVLKMIGKFFIDSFNGMAHGLFATLIIGVIICQIASLFNQDSIIHTSLDAIGSGLKLLMGVGIGIGIARSLKLDGIKLVAVSVSGGLCAYLQNPAGFGANSDPLTIYVVVVLTYLVIRFVLAKKTPVDVIIVPLIAAIISGVLTLLVGDYVKYVTTGIGSVVNSATELNPLPYGIIISVVMGMCLTAPISSAAIAISIGLDGVAAGAAVVGCSVQMIGFAVQSIRDNNIGKVISVGIGTSMLQFKNILKKPVVWLPTIIASAILGPIATMVFKLECTKTGAGMGTSGLVGVLQVFDCMGYTPQSILGVVILLFVAPIILVYFLDLIFRKLHLIKDGDLTI